jgi:hypothetical protein
VSGLVGSFSDTHSRHVVRDWPTTTAGRTCVTGSRGVHTWSAGTSHLLLLPLLLQYVADAGGAAAEEDYQYMGQNMFCG